MSASQRLLIAAVHGLPRRALSRSVRRLAGLRSPAAVRGFASLVAIDIEEAEKPLEAYESILELFTRRLKPGCRPIDDDPERLISPVDGRLRAVGPIGDGQLMQAKGRTYTLDAVLAEPGATRRCRAGAHVVLYLSPRDYHRVHAPAEGVLLGYTYVPGDVFPVNEASTRYVDQVYARNERVITHMATPRFGRVDIVKVGATNVGRIRLVHDPDLVTNTGRRPIVRRTYEPGIPISRGDELAVFELGSTVIVVTERAVPLDGLDPDAAVRVGSALGGVSAR